TGASARRDGLGGGDKSSSIFKSVIPFAAKTTCAAARSQWLEVSGSVTAVTPFSRRTSRGNTKQNFAIPAGRRSLAHSVIGRSPSSLNRHVLVVSGTVTTTASGLRIGAAHELESSIVTAFLDEEANPSHLVFVVPLLLHPAGERETRDPALPHRLATRSAARRAGSACTRAGRSKGAASWWAPHERTPQ